MWPSFFIHFTNDQILKLHGTIERHELAIAVQYCRRAILSTYLATEGILRFPLVDIIQSPILPHLLPTLQPLVDAHDIDFIDAQIEPGLIIFSKQAHFGSSGLHREWFGREVRDRLAPYRHAFERRLVSTTRDLAASWRSSAKNLDSAVKGFPEARLLCAYDYSRRRSPSRYVTDLLKLPERLEGQAFLWDVVRQLRSPPLSVNTPADFQFELALAYHWVASHINEYDASIVSAIPGIGAVDCGIAQGHPDRCLDLRTLERVFAYFNLLQPLACVSPAQLSELRRTFDYVFVLRNVFIPIYNELTATGCLSQGWLRGIKMWSSRAERMAASLGRDPWKHLRTLIAQLASMSADGLMGSAIATFERVEDGMERRVFIGHGRAAAWLQLKDFLADRLHMKWDEFNRVPVAGTTTTDRLNEMLDEACFAFIILTAEDSHVDGTQHARENAVHELGLFQGRLGVDRAIILLEEGCAEFTNIRGLTQLRFPAGNIPAIFEDVRRLLEHKGLL